MEKEYQTLRDFYPYYLSEHTNRTNKILHAIGTSLGILFFVYCIVNGKWALIPLGLIFGYAFAWVGHFIFEKNRPATFKYPLYSFACDFIMLFDILRGKVKV